MEKGFCPSYNSLSLNVVYENYRYVLKNRNN